MDWVSQLLVQAAPNARIDTRCRLPLGARVFHDESSMAAPFHLLVEGRCEIQVADDVIEMRAGDFLLLPRGQQHEVRIRTVDNEIDSESAIPPISRDRGRAITRAAVPGTEPVIDLFCGHYSFEVGAGRLFLASIPDPLHVNLAKSSDSDVVHLTSLLRSVAERDELGGAVLLDSLAQVLLVLALQNGPSEPAANLLSVSDDAVQAAVESVVADPARKWTAEDLARICHVSRATLVRRFPQQTGTTIAEFVTWVRVMRAADLLRVPGASVSDVSSAVGYASVSAFSKAFQSAVGLPPGRFARDARANSEQAVRADSRTWLPIRTDGYGVSPTIA